MELAAYLALIAVLIVRIERHRRRNLHYRRQHPSPIFDILDGFNRQPREYQPSDDPVYNRVEFYWGKKGPPPGWRCTLD